VVNCHSPFVIPAKASPLADLNAPGSITTAVSRVANGNRARGARSWIVSVVAAKAEMVR